MKRKSDSELLIIGMFVLCFVLAFVSYRQKNFRRQLNEVKELPYQGITVDSLADGIYAGNTATSFMNLELKIEVENKAYKKIEIVNCAEDKAPDIQKFIDELISTGTIKVPSKQRQMLEYLIFINCLDQAKQE